MLATLTQLGLWIVAFWQVSCCDVPLTANRIHDFHSVLQVDFAALSEVVGRIESGWLRVRHDGQQVVLLTEANNLVVWDIVQDRAVTDYQVKGQDGLPANMMDAFWTPSGRMILSLHHDGATYTLARFEVQTESLSIYPLVAQQGTPVRVWGDDEQAWLEWMPHDSTQIPYITALNADGQEVQRFASIAEQDRDSVVRIGRMPAPLAITANEQGAVRLWNLEQEALLHEVTLDQMPVFGHINGVNGRNLVWRDAYSDTLNLVDFESGAQTQVAILNGQYVQALLLGAEADVVLAVNVDLQPIVWAWVLPNPQPIELGEYRACGRTPDMVQLSENGTTLVIGCDTGIDVWRVESP